jgi:hypothetical protein
VPSGDIPAAPVTDFKTSLDSKISVWCVESDKSNLERIIAGMAATCQNPDKFDYVLFPEGSARGGWGDSRDYIRRLAGQRSEYKMAQRSRKNFCDET